MCLVTSLDMSSFGTFASVMARMGLVSMALALIMPMKPSPGSADVENCWKRGLPSQVPSSFRLSLPASRLVKFSRIRDLENGLPLMDIRPISLASKRSFRLIPTVTLLRFEVLAFRLAMSCFSSLNALSL